MRRTQVQFDDETYNALEREASERQVSVSDILRRLVKAHLPARPAQPWRYEDLTFIGAGTSDVKPGDALYPLSEHHDEALAEDLYEEYLDDTRA